MTIVYVITGGNRGIGYEIIRQLCEQTDENVCIYLCSRDYNNGINSKNNLNEIYFNKIIVKQLNICDTNDINALYNDIEAEHGHIDVLINNAGVLHINNENNKDIILNINYYSTNNVTDILLPLLRNSSIGGRVINISSQLGHLSQLEPNEQEIYSSNTLTREELNQLISNYFDNNKKYTNYKIYGYSKLVLIAMTKIYARNESNNVRFVSCHPGWVQTDMGGSSAPLSIEEGAETPVFLALMDFNELENGAYYKEKEVATW